MDIHLMLLVLLIFLVILMLADYIYMIIQKQVLKLLMLD